VVQSALQIDGEINFGTKNPAVRVRAGGNSPSFEFFNATESLDEHPPGFSWAKVVHVWPSLAAIVAILACVVALGWQFWQYYRSFVDPLTLGALFLLTMAFVGYRIFKA
jgi:hypothetical protein